MRQSCKNIVILLGVFMMSIALIGCQPNNETILNQDILTQKATEKGRTPITVSVKYAFTINNFEKIVEKKFPDIDIIQVGNYTSSLGIDEYEARLKNDDLTDIVMTWPFDVGEEYWEDRLIDLSGMTFSGRYNTAMLDSIEKDGKLYYLPGPSQIRGIIYNKTLFKEKGWRVPKDYNGFMELCQTIEKSGIRSLQLGLKNPEVLDTAFIGYNFAESYNKLFSRSWIEKYNQGSGKFEENFSTALDTFQEMVDKGVFKESDLDVDYSQREEMLFTRKCAMVEDSVLLTGMGEDYNGCKDEFALMPFFNKGEDSSWARLYMVCYIGLNKHLEGQKNKEKYDLVMDLMDYISTPEGQEALASDTGGMFSSVNNTKAPDVKEIKDMVPALENGRFAVFPELERSQDALRNGLEGILRKTKTKSEIMQSIDLKNQNPTKKNNPEIIGNATETFTLIKTGEYIADVIKEASDSEIGLVLDNGKDGLYNGKGVSGKLYKGDIRSTDIERIFPDLKAGDRGALYKAKLTGKDIIETLEHSITVSSKDEWIYYFSGLIVEFNVFEEGGKRVKKVTLSDGTKLDNDKEYTVAFTDNSVSDKFTKDKIDTKLFVKELIFNSIRKEKQITPNSEKRLILK